MLDFAIVSWILAHDRKACNPHLIKCAYIFYKHGKEYIKEVRKLLENNKMNDELIYLDQIEGLYLEMLRNYCLESFLSTIIISRILSEYILDLVYNILLYNIKTDKYEQNINNKLEYIKLIYENKAEAFEKYFKNIRTIANNYIHSVEKQGEMVPARNELKDLYSELIRKILSNAPEDEIKKLKNKLVPCTPSRNEAEKILEKTNKLLREFKKLVKLSLECK